MNTKIYYLYRDASNYKQQNEVVVEGEYTQEDVESIIACCEDGEYFIPMDVGWPLKRFDEVNEDDHCFAEIDDASFELTDEPPTELQNGSEWRPMTIGEAVINFQAASEGGWSVPSI